MPRGQRTVELDPGRDGIGRAPECLENEKSTPQRATLDVIQRALEAAGVEFTNGQQPGVRLAHAAAARSAGPASAPNPTAAAKAHRRKTARAAEKKR